MISPALATTFLRRFAVLLLGVLVLVRTESGATTVTPWTPVFQGIDSATAHNTAAESPGPLNVFVLRVALHTPGVSFTTTPSSAATYPGFETFSQTTGDFVNSVHAQAGINANFFSTVSTTPQPQTLFGLAISSGQVVSPLDPNYPALVITKDNVASIVTTLAGFDSSHVWTAVAGSSIVLQNGVPVTPPTGTSGDPFNPNPRSAVGLSQDGAYLYLMVIDGRTTASVGVTQEQVGEFLLLFGAYTGLNLDGGGSSALVQATTSGSVTVLNVPSGGAQRLDGDNLAVFASALPPTQPTVSLVSPADKATFVAGVTIPLTATASDPDGSVTKVEFFQGTTKLGESTSAPYTFNWTNVAAGTYSLTAVVTDNDTQTTTSTPVTITVFGSDLALPYSPVVQGDSPTAYYKLDEITGTAAVDSSGNLRNGTYPASGVTKGSTDTPIVSEAGTSVTFAGVAGAHVTVPYLTALNPGGSFTVEAWAKPSVLPGAFQGVVSSRNDKGSGAAGNAGFILYSGPADSATGDRWQFWIGGDTTQTYNFLGRNRAGYGLGPVVALNQWAYVVGTYAATSGPDGNGRYTGTQTLYVNGVLALTRANVLYLPNPDKPLYIGAGGNELITADSSRFTGNIDAVACYHVALTAAQVQAHYAAALRTISPPTVALTSPTATDTLIAPATLSLAAAAADSDGAVAKVEFYNAATKLGEDDTAPYTFDWTGVAPGTYVLTAAATDNNGNRTVSAAVTVTVDPTDKDNDGLPDAWEIANGLDRNNPADLTLDLDGDSIANGLEYALGTAANVPNRTGLPVLGTDVGKLTFTFNRARSELTYTVQASDDLQTWTDLAVNPGTAGSPVTVVDPNTTSPNRYLRLRVGVGTATFTTVPVGRLTLTFTQNQETQVSFPLALPVGTIAGRPAGFITAVGSGTLSCTGAGWSPGALSQAATPYLLRITKGAAAGRMFLVDTTVANTAATLTLATRGEDLTSLGLVPGTDTFELVPADTLATLFPAGTLLAGTVATGDMLRRWNGTAWVTYTFDGAHWQQDGGGLADNTLVRPDEGWAVRRRGPTKNFVLTGQVSSTDAGVRIARGATSFVSLLPVEQTFSQFPLQTQLSGWTSNPANPTAGDYVQVWGGTSWLVFYYNSTKWLRQGSSADAGSTVLLKPGRPIFIIRPVGSGADTLTQSKPY